MDPNEHICRGCKRPVEPGFNWHKQCGEKYRESVAYRAATLRRDGYDCARCPRLWNRLVDEWYVWRNSRGLAWLPGDAKHGPFRTERWVQVDHIDPIASVTGTHDPTNLQVLCQGRPFRHHPRKTRRDLAHLKGYRYRPTVSRGQLLTTAAAALLVAVYLTGFSWPLLGAAVLLAGAFWWWHRALAYRRLRLHTAYARITGASLAHSRQALKTRGWRPRKVGRVRPILVPTKQVIRYPWTFPSGDPEKQAELEQAVIAMNSDPNIDDGGWVPQWQTALDQLVMSSPDPLQVSEAVPSPLLHVPSTSLWLPLPVCHDVRRRPIEVNLIGKNVLLGGEPEAGKSVAQANLIAGMALDVDCDLLLNDLKGGVELDIWQPCSSLPMATDIDSALAQADYLRDIIEFRAAIMRRESKKTGRRKVKIEPGDGMGPIGVIFDELAELTTHGDLAKQKKIVAAIRSNISRGRFVGIIHVLATQRPSADVVPTSIRDIISLRWALRHTTPTSSDMTLGAGKAKEGFSAHRVSVNARGVGLIFAEGEKPRRSRSYYLAEDDIVTVARRAAKLRADAAATIRDEDARAA